MKTVTINGVDFELSKNTKNFYEMMELSNQYNGVSIYDVYKNPSKTKESILRYWHNWMHEIICDMPDDCYFPKFGVSSHNCNFFTLTAIVPDDTHEFYYLCIITARHNRAIRLTYI